jgi:hypothetical protein
MQSSSITHKHFSVAVSLNDNKTIFCKVVDTITFLSYEGTVDPKELRVPFDITSCYKIIINSFEYANQNYSVSSQITSGMLRLVFRVMFDGFCEFGFEVILREKAITSEGQLTIQLNRVEQQHAALIKTLIEQLTKLSDENKAIREDMRQMQTLIDNCSVSFGGNSCISSEEVQLGFGEINHIHKFYKLKRLTVNNSYQQRPDIDLSKFSKSVSVKELFVTIQENQFGSVFCSILGIENLPELETLSIAGASGLKDVVNVLSSYPHKIKSIHFKDCGQVDKVQLSGYCHRNNILLNQE